LKTLRLQFIRLQLSSISYDLEMLKYDVYFSFFAIKIYQFSPIWKNKKIKVIMSLRINFDRYMILIQLFSFSIILKRKQITVLKFSRY